MLAHPRIGNKTGLFSTRTPHRPNPVILTLAKLEKIDGKNIYLRGADLIDGTPVIDIKPYIPQYDSLQNTKIPNWILSPPVPPPTWSLKIPPEILDNIGKLLHYSELYRDDMSGFTELLQEVLSMDIRSTSRRERMNANEIDCTHSVSLCGITITFSITEQELKVVDAVKSTGDTFS